MTSLETNSPSKQAILKMMQRESSGDCEMDGDDISSHKENNNIVTGGLTKDIDNTNTNIPVNNTELKRVKVYVLEDNEWKDTGTGFCMGKIATVPLIATPSKTTNTSLTGTSMDQNPSEEAKPNAFLVVSNEELPNQVLLESRLEGNVEYQRQEETLIVWKDLEGHDIALSFEESVGCDTICHFIVQVQRNLERNISLVAVRSSDTGMGSVHEIIAGPISLPSIDQKQNTSTLMDALRILNGNTVYDYLKNETIEFVLKNKYIDLIIETFHEAEGKKALKDLLLLSSIIKTLILYNNRDIIELMVDDAHIMGIIGILEYDTEFPTMKANHRSYLEASGPIFKEVFPTENNDLKEIIKKCFRLQFLKDVVLVRFFDDSNINLVLDIILDFETCIINFLQMDPFLTKIMNFYEPQEKQKVNESISKLTGTKLKEEKRNGIKLLHQCVQMSKNLDLADKTKFYRYLIQKDLFNMLQYTFNIETDSNIRIMATDTIITIIEHDILLIQNVQHEKINNNDDSDPDYPVNGVNNNEISEKQTEDMKLLSILSTILLSDKSPGLREQVVQALNTLLHPDGCINGNGEGEYDSDGMISNFNYNSLIDDDYGDEQKWFNSTMDMAREIDMNTVQLQRYFKNFYDQIAPKLFAPLISKINGDSSEFQIDDFLLIHIVKLLSFISTEHNRILSRKFILENGILNTISKLVSSDHILQLRLTAVRAIKNIVSLNDKYYYRYMISNNLFDSMFDLLKDNISEDNLANSCIQDFFKIISINCVPSLPSTTDRKPTENTQLKSNFILLSKYLVERFNDLLRQFDHVPFVKTLLIQNEIAHEETGRKDGDCDGDDTIENIETESAPTENDQVDKMVKDETQSVEIRPIDENKNQNGKRVYSQI